MIDARLSGTVLSPQFVKLNQPSPLFEGTVCQIPLPPCTATSEHPVNRILPQIYANQTWRLFVCQRADMCALLLISVISTGVSGDAVGVFLCRRRSAGNIPGYGGIIHLSGAMMAGWKWSMLYLRHFGPNPALSPSFQRSCSDICWWVDIFCCANIGMCHADACLVGIDHLRTAKAKTVYANSFDSSIYPKVYFAQEKFLTRWNSDCLGDETLTLLVSPHTFSLLTADMLIRRFKGKIVFLGGRGSHFLLLLHCKNVILL